MLNRQNNINEITTKLAWIKAKVEFCSSLNLLDCNIHMEHFMAGLLNVIYGYNLVNLNTIQSNYTSIDLGDYTSRLSVQVTSDNRSTKIKETLDKFFENGYAQSFDRVIVLIIGDKKNYTTTFSTKDGFPFSKEEDIWDFTRLIRDISSKDTAVISAVTEYLRQELAPAQGYVGMGTYAVAEEMKKTTHALCLSKLMIPGIPKEIAETIIATDISSDKYQYVLDKMAQGKRYMVGGFGSGKSHTMLILCQRLLEQYSSGQIDVIPLYTHARDLVQRGSIQSWIGSKLPPGTKYTLFIDGLDEIDYACASRLIEEERYLTALNPEQQMLINSRPLTYLPEESDQIQIPKMLPAEQKALINTISEKAAMYFSPHTVQKDLQSCLELPLFCILYAVLKGGGDFGWVKNKIDLLTAFVDKATKRIVEGDKVIYDDLVNLSIHTTNRNYGDIHISEVTLQSSVDTILKTGLVEKQADYWSFPLAIVPQFLAAKALQLKKIDWQSVVASKEQIARWKYPLSILFSRASFDETFDLFAGVFCKAPGTAAQIISDGILTDRRESLPPAMECGKKLIQCMQAWVVALGSLGDYIAPQTNGRVHALGIYTNGPMLSFCWYRSDTAEELHEIPFTEMINYGPACSRPIPSQSTWPWIVTFELLSKNLEKSIKARNILGSCDQLRKEDLWSSTLLMTNKGSLYHDAIPMKALDMYRTLPDCFIDLRKKTIWKPSFFASLDELLSDGSTSIHPPFPVGDQEYSSYVWSCYSTGRYLELVRFVFTTALKEFCELADSVFSCLSSDLYIAQLSPCKLVGNLRFDPINDIHAGPALDWYLLALPPDQENEVDIDYRAEPWNSETAILRVHENRKQHRPHLSSTGFATKGEILRLNCPTPVTDTVYDWLESDLKAIGWIVR